MRWENGVLVRVDESGVARERGALFECRPETWAGREPLQLSDEGVAATVAAIDALLPEPVSAERVLVSEGVAEHAYGDRVWVERMQRVHLSLVRGRTRAMLDLATFDLDDIRRAAAALARLDEAERPAPQPLRVGANVTAALLPSLAGVALPNAVVVQTAGGVDGRGELIVEARSEWPNWFRPSYRVRPIRMPLNLRIEAGAHDIAPDAPAAVAIAGAVHDGVVRVIVDDGVHAYPATLRLTSVRAVSQRRTWYPYGGGSFGAEMML